MHLRSLILMGFCVAVGLTAVAHAETSPAPKKSYLFQSADEPAEEPVIKKGKKTKLTAKEKAKADKDSKKVTAREKAKAAEDAKKLTAEEKAKAKAKAAEEARAKAREASKMAMRAKAKEAAELARAKEEARKAAKLAAQGGAKVAARDKALAASKARQEKELIVKVRKGKAETLTPIEPIEPIDVAALEVVSSGNNGELRSDVEGKPRGFFDTLFGGSPKASMLPETRALDSALAQKEARKKFKVKPEFEPQEVDFPGYERGTIVINTAERRLYLIESSTTARRYAIAVGRDGLQFKGTVAVGDKQEWPRWIPTKEMQQREPKKYGQYKDGMPGGGENPLGARAIYLYQGKKDTHLRIHGTIAPQTIGTSSSNGCFRMINDHVIDLYSRVRKGTKVVII